MSRETRRDSEPAKPDDDSIISISSTSRGSCSIGECIAKRSGSTATRTGKRNKTLTIRPRRPRRRGPRRRGSGYRLEAGEELVWATQNDTGVEHQAIILHPQPEPQGNDVEHSQEMVCIKWHTNNEIEWIPRSNIKSQIKVDEAFADGRKHSRRKRTTTNRLYDTIGKSSQLACERESQFLLGGQDKKKKTRRGRKTCFTNVESVAGTSRKTRLSENVKDAIAVARSQIATKGGMELNVNNNYDGEWWHKPPIISYSGDDESVSSSVTQDFPDPDIDLAGEHDMSHNCKREGENVRSVTPQLECHVCASHEHHHNQIDKLLGDFRNLVYEDVDDFCIEFATYVNRFKLLLQGIEDNGCKGTSIFYHTCERSKAPNPVFTVAKLVQLFDRICQIIAANDFSVLSMHPKQSTVNKNKKALIQLLYRPLRVKTRKECGVILQMLHIATFEIINSRVDFQLPENTDQLLGVTFGLQVLQTMAMNLYSDSKTKIDSFLDRPLESYNSCIRRNCEVRYSRLFMCDVCGVRFHARCVGSSKTSDAKEDCCPSCKATKELLEAARANNLSNIYSLIVEKGASPIRPLLRQMPGNETALHVAIRNNNYDLASMLLFGSYLLLNCDDSLLQWDLPETAWGKDENHHTPFESGIDAIVKSMNVRPSVEILLLMCGRGAQGKPKDIQDAIEKRQRMMLVAEEWESKEALVKSDISMGMEPFKVPVASDGLQPSFMYVSKSHESRSTAIRWFDCRHGKGKQLVPFEGDCTMESLKQLHQKQSLPSSWRSYCNYLCECRTKQQRGILNGGKCECQLAEDGAHQALEVFETSDNRGFGLRVRKGATIKKHEFLCHYVGEIVTSDEAKMRDQKYANSHIGSYILDMDEQGQYCIDATRYRSVAGLMNHSCSEYNCKLFRALGNHLDGNFPYLGICAKEDISELTELTFYYGEKPEGFCVECQVEHCLCKQCMEMEHKK